MLNVLALHGVLTELKRSSLSYLLAEMSEKIEGIRKLTEEAYNSSDVKEVHRGQS